MADVLSRVVASCGIGEHLFIITSKIILQWQIFTYSAFLTFIEL